MEAVDILGEFFYVDGPDDALILLLDLFLRTCTIQIGQTVWNYSEFEASERIHAQ